MAADDIDLDALMAETDDLLDDDAFLETDDDDDDSLLIGLDDFDLDVDPPSYAGTVDLQAQWDAMTPEEQAAQTAAMQPVVYEEEPVKVERKKNAPRQPMMSGHCAWPQTAEPHLSHERCAHGGAGNRAVPDKAFAPCPCSCHLGETYECGNCGEVIRETGYWTGDGEVTYVHLDKRGRARGEDC